MNTEDTFTEPDTFFSGTVEAPSHGSRLRWDLLWLSLPWEPPYLQSTQRVLSVFLPLTSIPPSHLQPLRPERRVRVQGWVAGSLPSRSFQRYYLICSLLSDAEIQLQKLDMTSVAENCLRWMECSLKDQMMLAWTSAADSWPQMSPPPSLPSEGYKDMIAWI